MKLFEKINKKATTAIDIVVDDTKQLLNNSNDLVNESKTRLQIASYIIVAGFAISTIASLSTIIVCHNINKTINKYNIMKDILIYIKKGQ